MGNKIKTPLAFVIMSLDDEFNKIYTDVISNTLTEVGYRTERADDLKTSQNIMRDIITSIAGCDLIIAELTTRAC